MQHKLFTIVSLMACSLISVQAQASASNTPPVTITMTQAQLNQLIAQQAKAAAEAAAQAAIKKERDRQNIEKAQHLMWQGRNDHQRD